MFEIPEWPYYLGKPAARGVIRTVPQDFIVEEIPRVTPQDTGSHLWLWVEKENTNTDWLAGQLARVAGCANRDVGYAGLKDRNAVTRQWFSVPLGESTAERFENMEIEGATILENRLHTRKLKRGTLEGNRFELRVRQLKGDSSRIENRLQLIAQHGVPNYFGPQRFGHGGMNVERAVRLFEKRARLSRSKRSIYLSAVRSFLFNHVLAERVETKTWNTILAGELAMLDGSQSIFSCDQPDAEIEERCHRLDIHPTGPLPGDGGSQATAVVEQLERDVLAPWQPLIDLLRTQRLKSSRRALRLYPGEMQWDLGNDVLTLGFVLPAGAYATTVLREIAVIEDVGGQQAKLDEE